MTGHQVVSVGDPVSVIQTNPDVEIPPENITASTSDQKTQPSQRATETRSNSNSAGEVIPDLLSDEEDYDFLINQFVPVCIREDILNAPMSDQSMFSQ